MTVADLSAIGSESSWTSPTPYFEFDVVIGIQRLSLAEALPSCKPLCHRIWSQAEGVQPACLRFRFAGPLKERDPYREASPTERGPAVKDRDPSFPQEPLHNVGPSQPTRRPKARLVRSLAERTAVQLRVPINEIYEHVKTQLFDLISCKGIPDRQYSRLSTR